MDFLGVQVVCTTKNIFTTSEIFPSPPTEIRTHPRNLNTVLIKYLNDSSI
jgi:hypothetical protein